MQCTDARKLLDRTNDLRRYRRLDVGLAEHLEVCAGCRGWRESLQLQRELAQIPVPELREQFADEAIEFAWNSTMEGRKRKASRVSNTVWKLATAAAIVLAIAMTFQAPWWKVESPMAAVQVVPKSVRQVDLMMVSDRDLPDATITVRMDDHVSLAGYPDQTRLRWRAPIKAGENQLSLPVKLRGGERGVIVVEIESGGSRKQMTLAVEPAQNVKVTRSI